MDLDDEIAQFFTSKELSCILKNYINSCNENSPGILKIRSIINDHFIYIENCKLKNTEVTKQDRRDLILRIKNYLLSIENKNEKYNSTMYFLSWFYNSLLDSYNMKFNKSLKYINKEVINEWQCDNVIINENNISFTIQ